MDSQKLAQKKIEYHEGVLKYYQKQIDDLDQRLKKGESIGANVPTHEHHQLYWALTLKKSEILAKIEQEQNKINDLIFAS